MRNHTLGVLFFAVAFLATLGSVYVYVASVLDGDRLLSRSAVAGFLVFGAAAMWSLLTGVLS